MILTDITTTNTSAAPTHVLIRKLGQLFCNVCWMISYRATRNSAMVSRFAVQSARLAVCAGRLAVGPEPKVLSVLLPASCSQSRVTRFQQGLQHHATLLRAQKSPRRFYRSKRHVGRFNTEVTRTQHWDFDSYKFGFGSLLHTLRLLREAVHRIGFAIHTRTLIGHHTWQCQQP